MLCTLSCTAKAYETRAVEPYCTTAGSLARGIIAGRLHVREVFWLGGFAPAHYAVHIKRY